jgi:DNA repair photolyase
MKKRLYVKGRGAQINPTDPFARLIKHTSPTAEEILEDGGKKTQIITVFPKTIVNKVKSPDVGMDYSINPYQGCEHGCVYCYARNTHPYWGYSAGLDFEQKILVKKNAAKLLDHYLSKPKWEGHPIVLSGNTDCYQPIEQKFKITRSLLKIFQKFQHPVGIITKNSLIKRDIDILKDLSRKNLVHVIISINTLNETLRQKMEPRTASIKQRLQTMAYLAKEGIPVMVMCAPVIPGLNGHEVLPVVRTASIMGAQKAGYTIVRLNGDVGEIFIDWLEKNFPDRANKVISKIKNCHGGRLNDSRFKIRMKGEGNISKIIEDQFKLAVLKYMPKSDPIPLDRSLYRQMKNPQQTLF